jgi:hypothetical protein
MSGQIPKFTRQYFGLVLNGPKDFLKGIQISYSEQFEQRKAHSSSGVERLGFSIAQRREIVVNFFNYFSVFDM